MANQTEPKYLGTEEWGKIFIRATFGPNQRSFRNHFERDPRGALAKYFPEWDLTGVRIFRMPDNPKDPELSETDLKKVVDGEARAVALPYTCCC